MPPSDTGESLDSWRVLIASVVASLFTPLSRMFYPCSEGCSGMFLDRRYAHLAGGNVTRVGQESVWAQSWLTRPCDIGSSPEPNHQVRPTLRDPRPIVSAQSHHERPAPRCLIYRLVPCPQSPAFEPPGPTPLSRPIRQCLPARLEWIPRWSETRPLSWRFGVLSNTSIRGWAYRVRLEKSGRWRKVGASSGELRHHGAPSLVSGTRTPLATWCGG